MKCVTTMGKGERFTGSVRKVNFIVFILYMIPVINYTHILLKKIK